MNLYLKHLCLTRPNTATSSMLCALLLLDKGILKPRAVILRKTPRDITQEDPKEVS